MPMPNVNNITKRHVKCGRGHRVRFEMENHGIPYSITVSKKNEAVVTKALERRHKTKIVRA